MHRCFELAKLGAGYVSPNPMVGAVLVHKDRIIGEGYHMQYGQAHAEVNCVKSVTEGQRHLIKHSTMYVSLEPCAHYGQTPPCADLIIRMSIPVVVVACRDSFSQVDGKGIQKLRAAGVEVITPLLQEQALQLNRRFFSFHEKQRPYIILKWAQTANHKIAGDDDARTLISNEFTNRRVHQWRSEEDSILVGTNTALLDNPALTTRLWPGKNPVRLVIDKALKLPLSLHLFDGTVPTIVFNTVLQKEAGNITHHKILAEESLVAQLSAVLYQLKVQTVLVEGGAQLLQSFIDEGYWDEARIITNTALEIASGIRAPELGKATRMSEEKISTDTIRFYMPA